VSAELVSQIERSAHELASGLAQLQTLSNRLPDPTAPLLRPHLAWIHASISRAVAGHLSEEVSEDSRIMVLAHSAMMGLLKQLRWGQVDFDLVVLQVRRAKAGTPATHPLTGRELRALRRLERETGPSTHLFMSELKAPISVDGFQKLGSFLPLVRNRKLLVKNSATKTDPLKPRALVWRHGDKRRIRARHFSAPRNREQSIRHPVAGQAFLRIPVTIEGAKPPASGTHPKSALHRTSWWIARGGA